MFMVSALGVLFRILKSSRATRHPHSLFEFCEAPDRQIEVHDASQSEFGRCCGVISKVPLSRKGSTQSTPAYCNSRPPPVVTHAFPEQTKKTERCHVRYCIFYVLFILCV